MNTNDLIIGEEEYNGILKWALKNTREEMKKGREKDFDMLMLSFVEQGVDGFEMTPDIEKKVLDMERKLKKKSTEVKFGFHCK